MEILIVGMGCAKCRALEQNVRRAVESKGIDASIRKVEGMDDIVALGILATPAIVIDGVIKAQGSIARREEIERWL